MRFAGSFARPSGVSLAPVAVLAAVLGVAMLAPAAAAQEARMTIATPADGLDTSARSIVVAGTGPGAAEGPGFYERVLRVNGRRADLRARRDGSFSREMVLDVGRNEIVAKARFFSSWRDEKPDFVIASDPVVVTRTPVPGDGTGTLDLATSYLATDFLGGLYWLCGEGDNCMTRVACFQVTATRVDCPAGWREWRRPGGWRPWRCAFVATVNLRGQLLFLGKYRCRGRWRPDPQRFVRADVEREGRRLTVRVGGDGWLHSEVLDRNRYGLPRFDVDRDVFIP